MNRSNRTNEEFCEELLRRRYLLKDKMGQVVETPDQMYGRVAHAVAAAEAVYGAAPEEIENLASQFYALMQSHRFLPNSPTLMNAGRTNGMLSACFVLPVPDDIVGIFDSVKNTALIQKAGGGTGFTFDRLRPTGDIVASSGGTTSGPISFINVFAETTNAIQQGAHRRGANMGLMSIEHPDILKFITIKNNPAHLPNFNLSVKITDGFMTQLKQNPDTPHVVVNPRTQERFLMPRSIDVSRYSIGDLIPYGKTGGDCFAVADLWNQIVSCAHATGEPGIIFIDRVNRDNPTPQLGRIEATNPCGEQPLLDHEACNLGSINLAKFVVRDQKEIYWEFLAHTVHESMWFLDDVIDVNFYPIPEVEKIARANRKIGLGVMGFADCLIQMGIRYDSDGAVQLAEKVSAFIQTQAHQASSNLAQRKGNFPNWEGSIWNAQHPQPMRNATCTTIAPTGSIGLIARCSSGIEPVYELITKRVALDQEEFIQIHPLIRRLGEQQGWWNEPIHQALIDGTPVVEIKGVPQALAEVLVTAHEVEPAWHVKIAAAFQKNTDNAVSKTVNLPAKATEADVHTILSLAHELGCKGITVYRDGSRTGQTLSSAKPGVMPVAIDSKPRSRPRVTDGRTFKFRMGCGTLFVTVNRDDQGLCEVFANLGKAGGCPSQSEATCRAVSAALRSGVDPQILIEQLKGIRCLSAVGGRKNGKDIDVLSCPDAIARALADFLGHDPTHAPPEAGEIEPRDCQVCGHRLHKEANCWICKHCGESKCG
jgi:ribonucleoside-diphosphate reductase alpha chain